jgi:hypothetical protein
MTGSITINGETQRFPPQYYVKRHGLTCDTSSVDLLVAEWVREATQTAPGDEETNIL